MSVTSFFSSFLNTVHGDAPEEKQPESETTEEEVAEAEEPSKESEEEEEVEAEDVCLHSGYKCRPLLLMSLRSIGSPYHFGGVQKVSSMRFSNETFRTLPGEGAIWTRL
jgi:hypothetical protein